MNLLPPGYQAPEPELALRFGVSRTTIREALIRLEAEGLVELIPRRGARVLPIRADDMKEIYRNTVFAGTGCGCPARGNEPFGPGFGAHGTGHHRNGGGPDTQ